ncbi:hypothetical protein D046_5239B, partial [Vibrio parahaemolyticus V-223/04]
VGRENVGTKRACSIQ